MNILEFVKAVIRAGFRSRAFQVILVLGLALVGVAFLAASFSPRQPQTVALDVGLSGIRFSLILLALFWVQDFLGHEIDRKTVLHSLSYPVARSTYLVGRLGGILVLLGCAAIVLGGLLQLAVSYAGGQYVQDRPPIMGMAYWVALAGLWLGVAVVTTLAFLVGALSTVPMLPLAVGAAFAIAAQSLGAVADYLSSGADGDNQLVARYAPIVGLIRWVLPDLSRLDWRVWPMYGLVPDGAQIAYAVLMAAAYIIALFMLAIWVFRRRDFN